MCARLLLVLSFIAAFLPAFPAYALQEARHLYSPRLKSASEIYREEGKSVVEIETDTGQGSGVAVSSDGIIATNYHVIEGAHTAVVRTLDGHSLPVWGVLELDKAHDLALLKIKSRYRFKPIALGNTAEVKIGEPVAVIGNPEGYQNTISMGIVSGFRMSFGNIYWGFKLFQITAPISPGSSGGALLNTKGELIGITSAGYVQEAENLNVAVPIDYIKPMLPRTGRLVFVEKFAPGESSGELSGAGKKTFDTYLYFMDNLFQTVSDILTARERTLENSALKPDLKFYEIKARLDELAAMIGLNNLVSANTFEGKMKLGFSDAILKFSESDEDFIRGSLDPENRIDDWKRAGDVLHEASALLFESAHRMISADADYDGRQALLGILKKHPPFFHGELYYGWAEIPKGANRELVLCVYPDSPAEKAGIKEGDVLTSPLDDSPGSAYKKQIVSLEDHGKSAAVPITPVLFGFDSKPTVIGVEEIKNASISPGAGEAIEMRILSSLSRIPGVRALMLPAVTGSSPRGEAEQYGLDYILQGTLTQAESDSSYSLFPQKFAGYTTKLDMRFVILDPFGQATSCCSPVEASVSSLAQFDPAAFDKAASQLTADLLAGMRTSGIIKPAPMTVGK